MRTRRIADTHMLELSRTVIIQHPARIVSYCECRQRILSLEFSGMWVPQIKRVTLFFIYFYVKYMEANVLVLITKGNLKIYFIKMF